MLQKKNAIKASWRNREMKNFVKIAAVSALLAAPLPAVAATGNVQFDAQVDNTCSITVNQAGLLTANVGQTVLSSTNAGGASGQADILTTSASFNVSIDQPTTWANFPSGGDTNVAFAATYSASGDTTIASTNSANPLATGATAVNVDLSATKSSGSFPTGTYAAVVVLRCE
jgi:hypothetical protein